MDMVSRMPAMEPSLHRPHDIRLTLQPLRSMTLPQPSPFHDNRMVQRALPDSADLCSPATEEAYKGSWTEMEDEYLRKFAEVRNATSTACDASLCRNKCVELSCPHSWCSEDSCHHVRCTESECFAPNFIHHRAAPEGSLVMQPLDATLCNHLTNTEKLWTEIASLVSRTCSRRRNAKQCRERWFQQLRPGLILNLPIQPDEGELIAQLVHEKGQKWAEISRHARLQRRSDNAIKNWWNSSGNKKDRAANGSSRLPSRSSGPLSPQRVSKTRPSPHQHSHSAGSLNHIYNYAQQSSSQPTSHRRSPSYQGPFSYTTPSYSGSVPSSAPPYQETHPRHSHAPSYEQYAQQPEQAVYHGRRRESTLSISTSQTSSNSGPNTPMTSVSMNFGTSNTETKAAQTPSASSPKDPRMSITALCST